MTDDLQKRKQQLEQQRQDLAARLARIRQDYGRGLDRDLEEQAQELENAEVLNEISRVTAEELARVDSAIQRLEQALRKR